MGPINSSRKVFVSALALGALTILTNLFFAFALPHALIPLGTLFLYIAASTLGVAGSILAALVGLAPEVIYTEEYFYGVRIFTSCVAISCVAQRYPRIPSYVVVFGLWLAVFFPVLFTLFPVDVTYRYLLSQAMGEVLLCSVSSLLLLFPNLWGALSDKQRVIHSYQVLEPLCCALTNGAAISALLPFLNAQADILGLEARVDHLFLIFLSATIIPTFLAWHASKFLRDLPELGILGRSAKKQHIDSNIPWQREMQEATSPKTENGNALQDRAARKHREEEGICAITPHGTIAHMNLTFRAQAEVTEDDVTEKTIDTLAMNPELQNLLLQMLQQSLSDSTHTSEYKRSSDIENPRFYLVQLQKFRGNRASVITLKDITDQRTIEKHLLQAQKMKSLGSVVGGIAHAFNNALTNIIGQASFARRSSDKKILEKALNDIVQTATEAGELVWSLLDFAEGRPSMMKNSNVQTLIEERLPLLEKITGESYELIFHGTEQELGITCDANLLTQLLSNLIMNAKEAYNGKPGKIHLSLEREDMDETVARLHPGARRGNFARLRVQDFGVGMNTEVLEKAFDPLFTTKQDRGQSGLGLSVVYAILRAHDGFLSVESFPDKGTTLSLYFPLVSLDATEQSTQNKSLPYSDSESAAPQTKILVVEDEPSVRQLISKMLTTIGYSVESCTNGEEALDLSSKSNFDLILTDLMMPKMSGTEFIAKMKMKNDKTKVLIMTGHGRTPELDREGRPFLAKPFDIETLHQKVQEILYG